MLLPMRRLASSPSLPAFYPHISPARRSLGLRRQHGRGASARRTSATPVVCCSDSLPVASQASQSTMTGANPVSPSEWSGDAIRRRFLDFYAARGHKILPSSSLVPDDPTVFLTIAGMLQFKPIFLGKEPRRVPCATTSQKCIRTNDIENVGRTSRHQTFFEMLGNFSFGDYFKKDAIKWAWELTTKEYGLPPERLWISVFEDDDEAFSIWLNEVGVPKERIKRMGEDDNFWTSGATGPCGPCSEMYYDFHPERGSLNADLNDDSRFIEFYNLVFMQYNKNDDGSLEPLKQKNIDTGMGLERMARILQNVPNNYETDLIFPIMEKAASMALVSYSTADDAMRTNLKVIGDHMRAVVYLISDGIIPSNIGRGYVVRRLIRRVVRTGRLIGMRGDGHGNSEGAFLPSLAETVISLSSEIDPDVESRRKSILGELQREELRFVQTLGRGEKLLDELLDEALGSAGDIGDKPCLSGKDVFLLYDTYGFPIEITAEIASERGVTVDMKGFDIEMENQRKQSQAAHNVIKLSVGNGTEIVKSIPDTEFLGYESLSATAVVKGLLINGNPVENVSEGTDVEILLDRTPFYAESGGQIGDNGFLYVYGEEGGKQNAVIEIKDVQKSLGNIFVHKGTIKQGSVEVGKKIDAAVDGKLRQGAKAHHTATHLLQSALKSVIGSETSQAGSLVAFDRLRFDFSFHRPLTEKELLEIESLVNQWISDATHLETNVMALQDAKNAGATAMFGEKYGEQVRVVEVPGVSMELCGGTHVSTTAEIRGFKIISEQGIASGVRRIEAVAGDAFVEYVCSRDNYMRHLCSSLKVKAEDVNSRVETILEELRTARNEVSSLRSKIAVLKAASLASKAVLVEPHNVRILVENMGDVDADGLKSAAEHLVGTLQDPAAVILGSSPGDGKVSLVAAFSPGVVKLGVQAGKFVGGIAKLCGGGGGGKPNFAQAGGRKPENLPDALEKVERQPRSQERMAMTAIELEARNEPMEQEDDLSSSSSHPSSFYSVWQCRICHEEEDESSAAMESPCACSGSLKYAHRGCVQRWCDEKGSTLCEICLQSFEPGYTVPPKKAPVVEMLVTVSEDDDDEEELDGHQGMQYAAPDGLMDGPDPAGCSWCRPLAITFTIILLVWHLIAVVTIEAAEHCAFSLLTMYLLRAAGILLPLYAVMRVIRMIQHGRRQYRLQLLEEQRRRNASRRSQEEQQQLVIIVR